MYHKNKGVKLGQFGDIMESGFCFAIFIGICLLIIWAFQIWMLIDVVRRDLLEFDNKRWKKVVWFLTILFIGLIGAGSYYYYVIFKGKKEREKKRRQDKSREQSGTHTVILPDGQRIAKKIEAPTQDKND